MKPSEQTLAAFLNIMPAVLYEYRQSQDGSGVFQYVSPNSKDILGYGPEFFLNKDLSSFLQIMHEDDRARVEKEDMESVNDGYFQTEARIRWPSEEVRWVRARSKPASRSVDDVVTWVGCIVDITEIKRSQESIKILQGIIPICTYCKKIRDNDGAWDMLEAYISDHSEAQFSHGVCPSCFDEEKQKLRD